MLFNSLTFVVFFAVVLIAHNLPIAWRIRKLNLLLASYLFYMAWNPPFVLLLWLSTLVDWFATNQIHRRDNRHVRRLFLCLSLLVNLGVLAYFKYGSFILENFSNLVATFGVVYQAPEWDIILPVGISFYTFQSMAYTLDAYFRRKPPAKSFLDFALFVTFFPQLVAGPIVRPGHLIPQFALPRVASFEQLYWGAMLITLGLFQKIIIADGLLAPSADLVFSNYDNLPALDAWLGVLAFSGQILSDFAGYSTAAIGVALCLGFEIPRNFNFPYAAIGFSDFWRRWHISLSSWLRDYLYIPLGGNRISASRTLLNLLLVMLIGGLWHGASWTFVIWGGLHGMYLIGERMLKQAMGNYSWAKNRACLFLAGVVTFILVLFAWVFFRSEDLASALTLLSSMLGGSRDGTPVLSTLNIVLTSSTMATILLVHWLMRNTEPRVMIERQPAWLIGIVWASMLALIFFSHGSHNAFIYFQF